MRLILPLAAATLFIACSTSLDGGQTGGNCQKTVDCAGDLVCRPADGGTDGSCEKPCAPLPCPNGLPWNAVACACVASAGNEGDHCGGNISKPPPPCKAGLLCYNKAGYPAGDVGGTCSPPCRADTDCACPATCSANTGICVGNSVDCGTAATYDPTQCKCVPLMCAANGAQCSANGDCCSQNCILRQQPGFCCQPGGCP